MPRLKSEDVIINAPMSFAGAAQRAWRLRRVGVGHDGQWLAKILMTVIAVGVLLFWWGFVAAWYVVFGLLLLPYRILRRGARKRKKQALQHRELLSTIEAQKTESPPSLKP